MSRMGPFGERIKEHIAPKKLEVGLLLCSLITLTASIVLTVAAGGKDRAQKKSVVIQKNPKDQRKAIVVEVVGSIKRPGVYYLKEGQRVFELIKEAGGFGYDADLVFVQKNLNQARILSDQQKVYIPSVGELLEQTAKATKITDSTPEETTVNINLATQVELENLPGVGPVTAQKLIQQRPYSSLEELLEKKVLKKNTYEEIKELLTL